MTVAKEENVAEYPVVPWTVAFPDEVSVIPKFVDCRT